MSYRGIEWRILLVTNWRENFPWGTNDVFLLFLPLFFLLLRDIFTLLQHHIHKLCTHIHKAWQNCFQTNIFVWTQHNAIRVTAQRAFDSTQWATRWLLSPLLMHHNSIWAATQRLGWLLHFQLTTLNHKSLGKDLGNVFLQLLQCFSSKAEFALHVENHMSVCVIHCPVQICSMFLRGAGCPQLPAHRTRTEITGGLHVAYWQDQALVL